MLGIGAGVLNAQTAKGTVISGSDNERLIGASVMVIGDENGAVTDLDGNFAISAKNGQDSRSFLPGLYHPKGEGHWFGHQRDSSKTSSGWTRWSL